ncbi:GNAT family N-acetyltransferase [Shimazuella sp. AN120528]|uniref:GNAT family N-acetyltransferase n=1 Tax=Shimazuella soli TaxID=1892854 RepID=UPI001F105DD7|nr:GNAT family N-acetyltransferase [Shimazuella soli]MCH5586675.1 GNAT family N-acetyltransferase [Shimazuella soli]
MSKSLAVIKRIHTYGELKEVASIRRELWPNDGEVALDHMKFISDHGGIILGAYRDNQMVGYVYSFPGYRPNKVYLILQNIGVLPAYQHQKIGESLMQYLKEEARSLGYQEIIWTYEPLESVNAYIYLHKMGAVSSEYLKNCYEDDENGLSVDRFLTRLDLTDPDQEPLDIPVGLIEQSYKIDHNMDNHDLSQVELNFADLEKYPYVLIPVPSHLQSIRFRTELHRWRTLTRSLFFQFFKHGWEVFDLIKNERSDSSIHYYVARKAKG